MGSEHSSQQGPGSGTGRVNLQRGKSVPERESAPDGENVRPGSISPGPSICSDSDLPYISYTVNRPIGASIKENIRDKKSVRWQTPVMNSPKLPHKHGGHLQRGKSLGSSSNRKTGGVIPKRQFSIVNKSSAHNIVVVKPAASAETTDKDPDLLRLQSCPMFLPIMRGTLNLPAVRDPEVLERLDPNGLLSLCLRYQQHLALCSELVSTEQAQLGHKVRDIDFEISRLMTVMTERQKKYAKYAEKLGKVHELSHQLNRCHMVLNQTLESMETLNNTLPVEERLEPFVWTTG